VRLKDGISREHVVAGFDSVLKNFVYGGTFVYGGPYVVAWL
jgi:hypothetical protein